MNPFQISTWVLRPRGDGRVVRPLAGIGDDARCFNLILRSVNWRVAMIFYKSMVWKIHPSVFITFFM